MNKKLIFVTITALASATTLLPRITELGWTQIELDRVRTEGNYHIATVNFLIKTPLNIRDQEITTIIGHLDDEMASISKSVPLNGIRRRETRNLLTAMINFALEKAKFWADDSGRFNQEQYIAALTNLKANIEQAMLHLPTPPQL